MIYLATPYSDPDPSVMTRRAVTAAQMAWDLAKVGNVVYSPIAHWHYVVENIEEEAPRDFGFWRMQCMDMLERADVLMVYTLPGWDKGKGVKAEIDYAHKLGIEVVYL